MSETCVCGRSHTHCHVCGSRNVYKMKFRSLELRLDVYTCRRCGNETGDHVACQAPLYAKQAAPYTPYAKPTPPPDSRPQAVLSPGSFEYAAALAERYNELAESNKTLKTPFDIYNQLTKEGWVVEVAEKESVQSVNAKEPSLEDIIQHMKKEQ
jgi:hypothetical protein